MTNWYEKIKKWYIDDFWTASMVEDAYQRKLITKKERDDILASK